MMRTKKQIFRVIPIALLFVVGLLLPRLANADGSSNPGLQPPKVPSPQAAPAFQLPQAPPDIQISGFAEAAGPRREPDSTRGADPVIDTLNQKSYQPSLIPYGHH
jgi:hypothetical protein